MKKNKFFGFSSILLSTLIYSFFGVLTRIIGLKIPLFFQSWTRSMFTSILMFIPLIFLFKWQRMKKKDVVWVILRSLGGLIGFVGSFVAFLYIPFGTTYFIFFASSTITGYILGRFLFNEKFTNVKILSLFMAIFGLYFIYSFGFPMDKFIYALLALAAGIGNSAWSVFSKKISDNYSALQLNFLDTFITSLFSLAISVFLKEQWNWTLLSGFWLPNLLFIVLFFSTGQFMVYGFKHLDVHVASILALTEILFGIIIAFVFYKETVSSSVIIGGLAIIAAIIIPNITPFPTHH